MGLLDTLLPWRARAAGARAERENLKTREREQRLAAGQLMMDQVRHFLSATEDRRRPNWNNWSMAADLELLPQLPIQRSRARLMADNDPKAGGLVHKEMINTIGPRFSAHGRIPARERRTAGLDEAEARPLIEQAEEFWRETVAKPGSMEIDWQRFRPFLAYVLLMFRHVKIDGGLFLRFIYKPDRPTGFACRIIEPECVGTPPQLRNNNRIRGGLEFSPDGELVAFHIATRHPHDLGGGPVTYERVPIRNELGLPQLVFFFHPHRETASREMPWLQLVLTLLNDIADYKDSELQRKKMEADIAWFFKLNDPDGRQAMMEGDSAFGGGGKKLPRSHVTSPKRQVHYIEANEDIEVVDSDRPGSNYQPFLDSHDRDIGNGVGRSFERVSNNYGAANFSATRVSGIEDFVEHETEFALFAPVVFGAMWEWSMWWLAMQLGDPRFRLVQPEFRRYVKPSWDPESDATAAKGRQENTTSSPVEECAALGRDWETVIDNKLRVEQYEREARARMDLPASEAKTPDLEAAVAAQAKKVLGQQKKTDAKNAAPAQEATNVPAE